MGRIILLEKQALQFKPIRKNNLVLLQKPQELPHIHDWFSYVLSVNIEHIFLLALKKPYMNSTTVDLHLPYLCRVCITSTTNNGQVAIAVNLNATLDLSHEFSLPNLLETFEDSVIGNGRNVFIKFLQQIGKVNYPKYFHSKIKLNPYLL